MFRHGVLKMTNHIGSGSLELINTNPLNKESERILNCGGRRPKPCLSSLDPGDVRDELTNMDSSDAVELRHRGHHPR